MHLFGLPHCLFMLALKCARTSVSSGTPVVASSRLGFCYISYEPCVCLVILSRSPANLSVVLRPSFRYLGGLGCLLRRGISQTLPSAGGFSATRAGCLRAPVHGRRRWKDRHRFPYTSRRCSGRTVRRLGSPLKVVQLGSVATYASCSDWFVLLLPTSKTGPYYMGETLVVESVIT